MFVNEALTMRNSGSITKSISNQLISKITKYEVSNQEQKS